MAFTAVGLRAAIRSKTKREYQLTLTKQTIPTPALVVDLDALEANITRAAAEASAAGKRLRPHVKAHKCVALAKRQIAAGACGMCVATVPEAEMLTKAGIADNFE